MRLKKAVLLMPLLLASLVIVTPVSIATPSPSRVFLDPQEVIDTSLVPGTQFTINMCLDRIIPNLLWAYQLNLSFNSSVLHGVSVENGPFLESGGGTATVVEGKGFDNEAGTLGLFAVGLDPVERFPEGGSDEYGPLAMITFEVVGYGGSPITLGPKTCLANKTGGYIIIKRDHPEFFSDTYFDNRPPISIRPATVEDVPVGGSFTLNVSVTEMVDLYSYEFYMNWSAPLLNVTSVVEGDFLSDGTKFYEEIHNNEGCIYVNCSRTGATGVTGGGTLAEVTFLVEDEGNSTLHLYDTTLLDSAQNPLISMTIDGFFTNLKTHNIAVTSVTAFPSLVKAGSGDPIYINVTVENKGAYAETFNVTIYYDEEEIDKETDISLESGANITLMFTWDTAGVEMGVYSIKAVASVVPEEEHVGDNTRIYERVIIDLRNISITICTTSESRVNIGDSVIIGVIVENTGTARESFNVTTYYNETAIKIDVVSNLYHGDTTSLMITWNTTDVEPGVYLIRAVASVVPEETDTDDNRFNIGVIAVGASGTHGILPWEVIVIIAIAAVAIGASATTIVYRRMKKSPEEIW